MAALAAPVLLEEVVRPAGRFMPVSPFDPARKRGDPLTDTVEPRRAPWVLLGDNAAIDVNMAEAAAAFPLPLLLAPRIPAGCNLGLPVS